jgi:gluconate:H+ symporter, GntP family
MTPEDIRLLSAAVLGIGAAVVLILKGRLHPFVALLCGAFLVGAIAGQAPGDTAKAIQTGVGDILGGTGLVVALPTAIIAGPLLGRYLSRGVPIVNAPLEEDVALERAPPNWASALIVLTPVVLIAGGQLQVMLSAADKARWAWLIGFSNPVLALLLTNLLALPLLFGRALRDKALLDTMWGEAVKPAGAILLAIGAGGGLKQVLVSAGLSNLLAGFALHSHLSPLVLAWFVAVCIRLATGSATVATITAAGLMKTLLAMSGVSPDWMVLAIGAGSLFFSHVNDPGFWLVRGYLGVSTGGAFRTWSVIETVISVVGLIGVLLFSRLM